MLPALYTTACGVRRSLLLHVEGTAGVIRGWRCLLALHKMRKANAQGALDGANGHPVKGWCALPVPLATPERSPNWWPSSSAVLAPSAASQPTSWHWHSMHITRIRTAHDAHCACCEGRCVGIFRPTSARANHICNLICSFTWGYWQAVAPLVSWHGMCHT